MMAASASARWEEWRRVPDQPHPRRGKAGEACLAVSVEVALNRMPAVAPERSGVLSGAGASGSLDLPWALPRIVHASQTVLSVPADGSGRCTGREPAHVC